jgi:flagellar biosynthetic protein FliO
MMKRISHLMIWLSMGLLAWALGESVAFGQTQDYTGDLNFAAASAIAAPTPTARPTPRSFVRDYSELAPTFEGDQEPASWQVVLGVVGSLALVVVAIYGTLWALKVYLLRRGPVGGRSSLIRICETAHLSPNRALHVVEINGRRLLLGATDSHVSLLTELDQEKADVRDPFATRLAQAMSDDAPAAGTDQDVGVALDGLRNVIGRLRDVRS